MLSPVFREEIALLGCGRLELICVNEILERTSHIRSQPEMQKSDVEVTENVGPALPAKKTGKPVVPAVASDSFSE
jgi:hypothetical protein